MAMDAVAGGRDDAALVLGGFRIDEAAAQRLPRPPPSAASPRRIGGQDSCETAGRGHPRTRPA